MDNDAGKCDLVRGTGTTKLGFHAPKDTGQFKALLCSTCSVWISVCSVKDSTGSVIYATETLCHFPFSVLHTYIIFGEIKRG